jgi:(5-formylfuran-3-yl)methyl phosphate synthase
MTRLLVSVRSLEEAYLAADAGVDLIDLKEPRLGSLGRVDVDVARAVAAQFGRSRPLSMALGELAEWSDADWKVIAQIPTGIRFAKIGLAACDALSDWRLVWQRAIASFPTDCHPVAVVYADWQDARAPEPEQILEAARCNGCRALLLDTWRKDRGNVFTQRELATIDLLFKTAKKCGLLTVLAGSLTTNDLNDALSLVPDYIAVRGAVCTGGREGKLCPDKLRQWCEFVRGNTSRENRRMGQASLRAPAHH